MELIPLIAKAIKHYNPHSIIPTEQKIQQHLKDIQNQLKFITMSKQ